MIEVDSSDKFRDCLLAILDSDLVPVTADEARNRAELTRPSEPNATATGGPPIRGVGRLHYGSGPSLPVRAAVLLFVILVVATGVIVGVNAANGPSGNGKNPTSTTTRLVPKRAVPTVAGKTRAQAIAIMQAAGFKFAVVRASSTEVPTGHVIATEPPEGSVQPVGRTIIIVVSGDQSGIRIPATVIGMSPGRAEQVLIQLGFTLTTPPASPNAPSSETVPAGSVEATVPPVATTHPHGTPVELIISSGPPPVPTVVPDVSGETFAAASQVLTSAGFNGTESSRTTCTASRNNLVIFTNPSAGTREPKGSQIIVYVGSYQPSSPLCGTTST